MHIWGFYMTKGACCDGGSTFLPKWFLRGSVTLNRQKKVEYFRLVLVLYLESMGSFIPPSAVLVFSEKVFGSEMSCFSPRAPVARATVEQRRAQHSFF